MKMSRMKVNRYVRDCKEEMKRAIADFEKMGKRYGLLTEFRENGII